MVKKQSKTVSMISNWQPKCSVELMHLRAKVLHQIRDFFYTNHVLEVETPILCHSAGTDPYIEHFTSYHLAGEKKMGLFMQTSPEFAMKRLLSTNTESIYQICKVFRQGESGRLHNPEFTMLEWYRVSYNLQQLMDDVEHLLSQLLPDDRFSEKAQRICYQDVFAEFTGLDALQFDLSLYQSAAETLGFPEAASLCATDHAVWLDFLFSYCVQVNLGKTGLCMVYDYPASLPSLARLKPDNSLIVERVEVFIQGIELGNGYFELTDVKEQIRRFEQDNLLRESNGSVFIEMDKRLLAAMQSGLPDCSGIAIGLDRLLMIIAQKSSIDEVLTFSFENA